MANGFTGSHDIVNPPCEFHEFLREPYQNLPLAGLPRPRRPQPSSAAMTTTIDKGEAAVVQLRNADPALFLSPSAGLTAAAREAS
ncbi:hypothetical protein PR202_ga24850 [Eleusine coracana subsp. coracana]|uniref:Uncharacterized protein n=1 Tax=Eleusine coracana subsp. coracana TaxID=191504 RepID=A0AAV5D8T4_ELECO|nr:hypothetical protein PR202_ga24850 [Eleusine coracana subsp. coracana]